MNRNKNDRLVKDPTDDGWTVDSWTDVQYSTVRAGRVGLSTVHDGRRTNELFPLQEFGSNIVLFPEIWS